MASDVPLAGLPEEMRSSLNKPFARLIRRNTDLAAAASNTADSKMTPGTLAPLRLPVRSPHPNGAGWLQVHSAADSLPGLDAAALAWVQGRVANPLSTGHRARGPVRQPPGERHGAGDRGVCHARVKSCVCGADAIRAGGPFLAVRSMSVQAADRAPAETETSDARARGSHCTSRARRIWLAAKQRSTQAVASTMWSGQ